MKILLADDNADHRELIECALKENLVNVEVDSVDSGDEASNCLADPGNAYDLVLLDYNLPGNSGLEILQYRGADLHQPPVVMITGQGDEKVAAAAIKAGAYDYIVKDSDYLTRLPVVAQRAVDSRRLKIERQRVDEALRASQALNQAIINNAPIGISVRSKTGQLILANDAWKKIWAIPKSAVIDDINRERHTLVFDQRDKYLQPYQEDLRQVYEQGADLVLPKLRTSNTSRPGSAAWVSQHFYALRDEFGEVDRVRNSDRRHHRTNSGRRKTQTLE